MKKHVGLNYVNFTISMLNNRLIYILTSLFCLSFAGIMLGAYIYLSNQSKIQPFLITVDNQGVIIPKGSVQKIDLSNSMVIGSVLCNFLENIFTINDDKNLVKQNIIKAYAYVDSSSKAKNMLDKFFKQQNPFEASAKGSSYIQINNVIRQTEQSFQIDFTQIISSKDGSAQMSYKKRALININLQSNLAHDSRILLLNPLGIYIKSFLISEIYK